MSYRDEIQQLGAATEREVVSIFDSWTEGLLEHDEAVGLIAAAIARANSRAVTLADLSLAATLTLTLSEPVPPLGLTPPEDDHERLRRAAATLLGIAGVTRERAARLGRSEPLSAAADAYSDGMDETDLVDSWTRAVEPDACPACQKMAGAVLPTSVPMWHHTGCTCIQQPVKGEQHV